MSTGCSVILAPISIAEPPPATLPLSASGLRLSAMSNEMTDFQDVSLLIVENTVDFVNDSILLRLTCLFNSNFNTNTSFLAAYQISIWGVIRVKTLTYPCLVF